MVFGWDANDVAYDNASYTGWHTGYPDATAVVDLQTFREIPWEKDLPFFIADFRDAKGNSLPVCPRSLLKKIADQATDAGRSAFWQRPSLASAHLVGAGLGSQNSCLCRFSNWK